MKWKPDRYFLLGVAGAAVVGTAVAHHAGWYQSGTRPHVNAKAVWNEVQSSELSWSIGRTSAPVSVIELLDLGCPACASFYEDSWAYIRAAVDSGTVAYTSFPFPLPVHPNAMEAALVADCAGQQDQTYYWAARPLFYSSQNAWTSEYPILDRLVELVMQLGVDRQELEFCLRETGVAYRGELMAAWLRMVEAGVDRTPFVLVDEEVVDWTTLRSHIEERLR